MMTLIPFLANAFLASVGAMMLVSTPNKAIGVLMLTFNGLCAVLCALMIRQQNGNANGVSTTETKRER